MNCDVCGTSIPSQTHCACSTNCSNNSSETNISPSTTTTSIQPSSSNTTSTGPPYRGRRWMLRRASARSKQDSSVASSSSSPSPVPPLTDLEDRKFVRSTRVPVDVDVEIGGILSEIADGPCEFGGDIQYSPNHESDQDQQQDSINDNVDVSLNDSQIHSHNQQDIQTPQLVRGVDIDVDVDLDAESMVVSAAHSETASTVSRAAFSVSDRAETDPREQVALLIDSQTVREDNDHNDDIPLEKPTFSNKNTQQRLQAAYFREIMLSSLRS